MRLRVADDVGVEVLDNVVYAAPLPDGPILVFGGIAGLIWIEACATPREDVARVVGEHTDQDVDAIHMHVDAFVSELIARGLLVGD